YPDAPVIFPTCDSDVLFLAAFASRLAPHYRLPAGLEALPRLMDKMALASIAERAGLPTPRTLVCDSEDDIRHAASTLQFPLVMKPRSAHEWRKKGVWQLVGARKAIMVESPAELEAEYRDLRSVSAEVLLQEF